MKVQQLFKIKASEYDMYNALNHIESEIDRTARFKTINVDMDSRIVHWVTQEMDDRDMLASYAKLIATKIAQRRLGLWSVYMCVRDEFSGFNDFTDWVKYETL